MEKGLLFLAPPTKITAHIFYERFQPTRHAAAGIVCTKCKWMTYPS